MIHKKLLLALISIFSVSISAQQLTIVDYKKAEQQLIKHTSKLITGTIDYPVWADNGDLLYRSHTEKGDRFFKVNPQNKQKVLAFDHNKLAKTLSEITKDKVTADKFPFKKIDFNRRGELVIKIKDTAYRCDLTKYSCKENKLVNNKNELIAPDGHKAVFIREHNLWLRTFADNKEVQLTHDGIKNFGYATNNAGWVRRDTPVVKWSPDSKKLTTFKHDSRHVGDMAVVSTSVGHPEIDQWKYPLPGDKDIFTIHRVVIDVEQGNVINLDMKPDAHRSTITDHVAGRDGSLLDIDWSADSQSFAFVSSTRDHKTATLKIANASTGAVQTVYSETKESFYESGIGGINWRYLEESNQAIWFSQHSDWGHLYLVDLNTGKIKNHITQGNWNVLKLLYVDEKSKKLIFTGAGREGGDPYFHYLYSVNIDGTGLTLLTPEKKHHRITLSKDGLNFLDRISTPNIAEVSFIRNTKTRSGFIVEQMNIEQLTATGWQAPEPFVVKDRNGKHHIYGLMYKPSNFDKSKSYPVINYLYPGPQVGSIRGRHFRAARGDHQAIAELGFILIEIDALGTPGRSKSFHDFYYENMGDSGIPDQVAAIKQLAKKHSWIDDNKVGIWGHSGGGFASTRAMLIFPDFYKVAVSEAGNHDNRNYADEWGEKYHGLLVNNDDGTTNYDSQANQLIVDKLQGKLMLVHGTTDTNVPPYNTLLVVEALIKANKDFDMLMLPNRGHGFARESYMVRKRWDYFVKHLMGATPPKEFSFEPEDH
ncbi:MAG: DPP IV N-terminal domain-containing protein [Colwellia sp.]|nr:DPP IV N-terminal domain-containing protein [Colwellia sp.]